MNELFEQLCKLSDSCFIGNITKTRDIIADMMKPFCDSISPDKTDGLICTINGKTDRKILFQAHMDEIGMIVTKVLTGGFVRVGAVGGVDIRVLPSSKVVIHGKSDVRGIFTSTPPHLAQKDGSKAFSDFDELMVDTGLDNAEDIINTGDFVTFDVSFAALQEDYVTGKSLDNRTGCLALIKAAQLIHQNGTPQQTIVFSFSSGEELGNRGARTAAFAIDADEAVAVDVSFGLSPMAPPEHCGILGKGTMLGVSPVLSRDVIDKLTDSAENSSIPYQLEIMGGRTSTDADVISITKAGVKCGLLSIPLKYMHTPIEVVKLSDIENVALILAAYAKSGELL